MTSARRLILASSSPRRKSLLEILGIPFDIITADVSETPRPGEAPTELVLRLAEDKAEPVAIKNKSSWIIAADTIVVLPRPGGAEPSAQDEVLGKPRNPAEATQMLSAIQGREHFVYTGFILMCKDAPYSKKRVVQTKVRIRELDADEISAYVATKEPFDKAGSYGAQGIGCIFIESIVGSYTNVVGLPMSELLEELKLAGVWHAKNLSNCKI